MADEPPTVLTQRQMQVLRLRSQDRSVTDIARLLSTSKQNVHSLEKAALSNVERARNTLAFYRLLSTPVVVTVEAGEDIQNIVTLVLKAADDSGIRIMHNRITLANAIYAPVPERFRCTKAVAPFDVGITWDGEVVVGPCLEHVGARDRPVHVRATPCD